MAEMQGLRTSLGVLPDLARPRTVAHTTHLVTGGLCKRRVRESCLTWFQEKLSSHKPSKTSLSQTFQWESSDSDSAPTSPSNAQMSLTDSFIEEKAEFKEVKT